MSLPGVSDLITLGFSIYEFWNKRKKAKALEDFSDALSRMIDTSFDFSDTENVIVKENILENMFSGFKLNTTLNELYAWLEVPESLKGRPKSLYFDYELHGLKTQGVRMTLETEGLKRIPEFLYDLQFFVKHKDTSAKYLEDITLVEILSEDVKFTLIETKFKKQITNELTKLNLGDTEFKKFSEKHFSNVGHFYRCRIEYIFIPPLVENDFFSDLRTKVAPFLIELYDNPQIKGKIERKIRGYFTQVFEMKILEVQMRMIEKSISKNLNLFLNYVDNLTGNEFASWWIHYFDPDSEYYKQPFVDMNYKID